MLLARGERHLAPTASLRCLCTSPGGWVGHLDLRVPLATYAEATAESIYKANREVPVVSGLDETFPQINLFLTGRVGKPICKPRSAKLQLKDKS